MKYAYYFTLQRYAFFIYEQVFFEFFCAEAFCC